jgi:mono/diheme cytochrome c family protein
MAPVLELRGKIAWWLARKRGVGGTHAFPVIAVARCAGGQAPCPVPALVKGRGQTGGLPNLRRRRSRHRRVEIRNHSSVGRAEPLRDEAHLRMASAAVGVGNQLPFEIAAVQPRQPWCEPAVALALKTMTGEAGVRRAGPGSAEGDEFACAGKTIHRFGRDRRASGQRGCAGKTSENGKARHTPRKTGSHGCWFRDRDSPGGGTARRLPAALRILLVLVLAASGCKPPPDERTEIGLASAGRGKLAIERAGCGSCHTIEGIRWPKGATGPNLGRIDRRALIAGRLPNRPDVLAAFVRDAPALLPGTTMPAMPLTERESLDVAAYLYEIGR